MKKTFLLFVVFACISSFAIPTLTAEKNLPSFQDSRFGDWVLRSSADPEKDFNYIFTGSNSDDGKISLELGVLYDNNAKDWVVVYQFNPSADKEEGVEIAFPDGIKGSLPIPFCNEDFCQAAVSKNSGDFIKYLNSNSKGTFTFVDKEEGKISIPFSLKGFKQAFKELQKIREPEEKKK